MPTAEGKTYERLVGLLRDLVQIESTTGHEGQLAAFIYDYLLGLGLKPELVPLEEGRSSVGVRVQGRGPGTVVFCGHIDTVDVRNQCWSYPPFGAIVEGNRMFGRGTADMKGGIAAMLGAVTRLVEGHMTPAKSVILAFTADEEQAYGGAISLLDEGFMDGAELLIIPEPTEGRVCLGQKGQLWVDVDFAGRAAHGALPEYGANAALAAADFSLALTREYNLLSNKPGLGRSTVSANEIHGGWQVNVIPDVAHVTLDFRVVDIEDRDAALAMAVAVGREIYNRWGVKVGHRVRQDKAALVSDPTHPAVHAFIEAAENGAGSSEHHEITAYSTDGAAVVPRINVPIVVCGPGSIAQAHQPDEYLDLEQLFDVFELFVRYLSGRME